MSCLSQPYAAKPLDPLSTVSDVAPKQIGPSKSVFFSQTLELGSDRLAARDMFKVVFFLHERHKTLLKLEMTVLRLVRDD